MRVEVSFDVVYRSKKYDLMYSSKQEYTLSFHPFTGRPLGVVANDKVMLHRSFTQ